APYLLSAVIAGEDGRISVLALNRHLTESMKLNVSLRGCDGRLNVANATELVSDDLSAVNTPQNPDRVAPRGLTRVTLTDGELRAELAPASWNVIELQG
ncbi:MAG: alpha-N-arabinofuranosidase, partial [Hyphomicrobiales bacterium]|nr:alpha-N-arabinofuranosidase [Hyphomicrobiales bacterium]